MTEQDPQTVIDAAHTAMEAAPEDTAARMRFYDRIADAELFVLLAQEAEGETLTPQVFEVDGDSYVLAFDTEERLGQFAEGVAPYAALSGRVLAAMLAGQGAGLGLNLHVAPSSIMLPPAAMAWLAETLTSRPEQTQARPVQFGAPGALPPGILQALDAKLVAASGLATGAYLCGVEYDSGAKGHLLVFANAQPGAEDALAKAVNEALTFSGLEAGVLDVVFLKDGEAALGKVQKVALRFDLPEPEQVQTLAPSAPGMDPDKPPRLR